MKLRKRTVAALLTGTLLFLSLEGRVFSAQETSPKPAPAKEVISGQKTVISPGDKLFVRVAEDPNYGGFVTVSENGLIILSLLNEIDTEGLTPKALGQKIKEKLEEKYFWEANVEVSIYESRPRLIPSERSEGDTGSFPDSNRAETETIGEVNVWGQVFKQGTVPIFRHKKLTVTKAIIASGGFSDFAKQNKVRVIRIDENGKRKEIIVNVAAVMKEGLLDKDLELKDGDYVIVPQSFFNF